MYLFSFLYQIFHQSVWGIIPLQDENLREKSVPHPEVQSKNKLPQDRCNLLHIFLVFLL